MAKNKGVTIAALLIAIVGLSVGFAAFSNVLTIKSTATVNPNRSNFSVVFSTNASTLQTNPVAATNATYGDPGTINNREGNPTLTGLKAKFTAPGQSAVYNLYVLNNGQYDAYLTNLNFDPQSGNSFVRCISGNGATDSLTQAACNDIYVTVSVGSETFSSNSQNGLTNTLSNHLLQKNTSEAVTVTIGYADNTPNANHYVDGPVTVLIGDIQLQYRTVNTPTQTVIPEPTPTDSSCFVSVIPGQINDYLCNNTELIIEDNLQLGVREVETISFNSQKCSAFESMLVMINANYTCSNLQSQFNSKKDTTQGIQEIYSSFLGALAQATYGDESTTKNNITTIGQGVFAGRSLTSVELGEGITTISMVAFTNNSISNLKLPSTLTTVGDRSFTYNSLTSLTLPSGLTTLDNNAFSSNHIEYLDLSLATSLTTIGQSAFYNNEIENLIIPGNITTVGSFSFKSNQLSNLILSNGVTTIGAEAFGYNMLSSITLPNTLTTIDSYAFGRNRLMSINIPNSVATIGAHAFDYNDMKTVSIGSGITSIGNNAFWKDSYYSTDNNTTYGNALTSVTINVACDTYKNSFTQLSQFGWAQGYSDNNIVWGTECSN